MKPNLNIVIPPVASAQAVYLGPNLLAQMPELLKEHAPAYRYALITDSTVENLYGKSLLKTLNEAGLATELFSFPAGENSKNEETKRKLDHALLEKGFGRDTVIIALGGGVVGDMAGFVAATYLRGIPFIQVPTTVLSMVDSSIGGKVGIDTPYGKNLLGAFWHPRMIVADLNTLESLSEEQIQNGWFEAIKMFACLDKAAYEAFKKGPSAELMQRAMELKIQVVQADEREAGLRSILNFGHSVGHALEKLSNYSLLHGFAIALGMLVEARVSVDLGQLSEANWSDLKTVLMKNGLQISAPYSFDELWSALQNDKKNRAGEVKVVLLEDSGARAQAVTKEQLQKAWDFTLKQA